MLGNAPIVCGGGSTGSCLTFGNSQWSLSHFMSEKRARSASVQINSSTLWVLGGDNDSGYLNSTEFIRNGQKNGVPGRELPYRMRGMCAVKLSHEEIFLIGGEDEEEDYRNEVWIFNPKKDFSIKPGPSLNTSRAFHSCGTMRIDGKPVIVVAGGWNLADGLDSVEIYDPTDKTWHSGKEC